MFTTSGKYPSSFVRQIFHNGLFFFDIRILITTLVSSRSSSYFSSCKITNVYVFCEEKQISDVQHQRKKVESANFTSSADCDTRRQIVVSIFRLLHWRNKTISIFINTISDFTPKKITQ
jgi:hypothetical protein